MALTTERWPADTALQPDYPALPLFGWIVLVAIGQLLVVPAPWTVTGFYRFLCRHVALPNGRQLRFTGWPGDIWYALGGIALLGVLPEIVKRAPGLADYDPISLLLLQVALALVDWCLLLIVIHWFVANVQSEDRRMSPEFVGSLSGFIGWQLLLILSLFTVIGWAWVTSAFLRWLCRNVKGNAHFDFTGSGFEVLWRTVAFVLVCMLILPIPWALQWMANWYVSRITVMPVV